MDSPLYIVESIDEFPSVNEPGVSRYRHTFAGGRHLDALIVNRGTGTLVVSFHGAIDRGKYEPPRFERYKSLNKLPVSALYLGDPALWIGPKLELAWHTGWEGLDLYTIYAGIITRTAAKVGARNIVLSGGSGGGFAALQVSALIPDSMAVAYNPQTSIYAYEHPKWPYAPQKSYLRNVWPNLLDEDPRSFDFSYDWTLPLGDRLSAVRRYSVPQENRVFLMINRQDTHHVEKHFKPFVEAMKANPGKLKVLEYDGGSGHKPSTFTQFQEGLFCAAKWAGFTLE